MSAGIITRRVIGKGHRGGRDRGGRAVAASLIGGNDARGVVCCRRRSREVADSPLRLDREDRRELVARLSRHGDATCRSRWTVRSFTPAIGAMDLNQGETLGSSAASRRDRLVTSGSLTCADGGPVGWDITP